MSKLEEILNNTTILFDDIEEYQPKLCIIKEKKENGMYHLEESRILNEEEIFRIFSGLAKFIAKNKNGFEMSNSNETIRVEIKKK